MLSDHELEALRDIERRLRWTSPELVRLFDSVEPPPKENRRKRARARMLVAAGALAGLALLGPRMLNEAEVRAQQRPPLPRTSPPETTVVRRGAPGSDAATSVTAPVTAIDLSISSPTAHAAPSCRAQARDTDTAVPLIEDPSMTTRPVDRRAVLSESTARSRSRSADRDARAESEATC